jgi:hypothetical protein
MAVLNRLDPATTADALGRWLGQRVGHPVEIRDLEIPASAGISDPVYGRRGSC